MNEFYIDKLIEKIFNDFPELSSIDVKQKNYFFEKLNERFDYKKENKSLSVKQIINDYVNNKVKTEYKDATEIVLFYFHNYLQKQNCNLLEINEEIVQNFIKEEYESGKKQGSIRVRFSRINQFYKYLENEKFILQNNNPFNKIKLAEININQITKAIMPTEDEIIKILNNLSLEEKTFLAIVATKGYNTKEFYELSFNSTLLETKETKGRITVTYCWINDDLWNYESNRDKEIIYSNDCFDNKKNFYEYISTPEWYNEILTDFWNEYIVDNKFESDGYEILYSELYYLNHHIDLGVYEKKINETIKKLYKEKELNYLYKIKDFRLYAIKNIYKNTKNIRLIQKLLNHSTSNTTRRFLQNAGIEL